MGANGGVSLIEAQRNFASLGAMDERFKKHVRPPTEDEPIDEAWRPIDPERDSFDESGAPSSGLDYFHASKELDTDAHVYWRSGHRRRSIASRLRRLWAGLIRGR